jgi:hypothetical protein
MFMIELSFFLLIVLCSMLILIWTVKNRISPTPTTRTVRKAIACELPENIEGTIVELGSGWGGIALFLAKKYPKAEVYAYETSPLPWLISNLRARFSAQKNIHFERKDFFLLPLSNAKLIWCYLSGPLMERLQKKLSQDTLSGTLIISNTFALPKYTPTKILTIDDLYKTKIYFYLT